MPFPSVLSTFNRPAPTDRLNNPSHSALHNTVSSAVGQIEAVIGVEGPNSIVGTLEYFIKSPDSSGGGHVQTASVGGTGQTSYTKGDILVATGPVTLAKLALGTQGQVLQVDTNQSSGLKYSNVVANKIAVRSSLVSYVKGQGSVAQVLFAASILGSTLGTGNAVKFKGAVESISMDSGDTFTVIATYGPNSIASMTISTTVTGSIFGANGMAIAGLIEGAITANGATNSQQGYMKVFATDVRAQPTGVSTGQPGVFTGFVFGTSSVESSANQDLIITGQFNNADNRNSVAGRLFIVEKIA